MSTVLLTGFEPWKEFKTNPSQQIAERLNGQTIGGAQIVGLTLPVVFGEDTRLALRMIDELKPDLVLCLGLHAGRPCLDLERFAINLRSSDAGDSEHVIVASGPAAYFATLDIDRIGPAVARAGVPVQPHGYAGNFLCNHIMYQVLHHAATNGLTYQAGFIHLPQSSEAAATEGRMHQPSLSLDTILHGVRVAIEEALS